MKLTTTHDPDNPTWDQSMNGPLANEVIAASLKEQESFKVHGTIKLVRREEAEGHRIFRPKAVITVKRNSPTAEFPEGEIYKVKYRLTIQALAKLRPQGIDFEEKYASTVTWNSIKTLLAVAVNKDLDLKLLDIKAFFLYGKLPEDRKIYMEQVDDWVSEDKPKEKYICQVIGNMYGLGEAPGIAKKVLHDCLTKNGDFIQLASDDCVYRHGDPEGKYCGFGCHVDDLTTIGTSEGIALLEQILGNKFEITVVENPTLIMGVQIERNREKGWLLIHQRDYTAKLLAENNMTDCKGADTPIEPGAAKALMQLPQGEPGPRHVVEAYQALVGSLIWLMTKTRPDLSFTVNFLCRFLKNPTQAHLDFARNRPLRFLKRTQTMGVAFQASTQKWELRGAADSDLGGDLRTGRSTMGHYLILGGQFGTVLTSCRLDRKISVSTGQAETYALQDLVKDTIWLKELVRELGYGLRVPTPLGTDNDGVWKQSKKAFNHSGAKHYRLAQGYIRQAQLNRVIDVESEDTDLNASDIFTKALSRAIFIRHQLTIMGPQQPL